MKLAIAGDSSGEGLAKALADHLKDRHEVSEISRIEGAAEGAGEIGRFIGRVPTLLTRAGTVLDQLDDATRDGLKLDPETVAAIGEAEAHRNRWITRGIWVIAVLLLWVVLKAF